MRKSYKFFTTIITILCIVFLLVVVVKFVPKSDGTTQKKVDATTEETTEAPVTTESEVEDKSTQISETEASEATPETSEVVANEATAETTDSYEDIRDEVADIDKDELAYKEDVTEEDIEAFKEFLEEQPDVDESMVEDFFLHHPELDGYRKDPDGVRMPPLTYNSLMVTDDERPYAAVKAGLQKDKKPIDDAISYPFTLTVEQVQKILAAPVGGKIDFSEEELEEQRLELFRELLENPVLFESWMRLVTSQKIGEDVNLVDHWKAGQKYIELSDQARADGRGMNIWLRKVNGIYYTNAEYSKYVIALIELLWPRQTKAEVLTAKAGDHYHLIPGDFSSMRQATPSNYEETLASMTFTFYLKNGKVGIRFGANYRDKRPEVLNFTSTPKPVAKKTTKKVTNKKVTKKVEQKTTTPEVEGKPESKPTVEDKPESKPTVEDKPDNEPDTEDKKKEEKHPDEGSGSSGNADTGGGQNDDKGPGEQKPDQGNSSSDKVDESQYQQGNSENTTEDKSSHDNGPKADNTDNGKTPDTAPIVNEESKSKDDYQGGDAGSSQENTGEISMPD